MDKQNLIDSGFLEFSPSYYINESGLIFSLKSDKFLKPTTNPNGYMVTEICTKGKRKKVYNHIKVVEMFGDCHGNRIYPGLKNLLSHGISIDHLNSDRLDPRRQNLELVAHKLNCERRSKNCSNELGF